MDLKSSAYFKNQRLVFEFVLGRAKRKQSRWGRRGGERFVLYQHRQRRNQQRSYDFTILVSHNTLQASSVPLELRTNCRANAIPGWEKHERGVPSIWSNMLQIYSKSIFLLRVCLIKAVILASHLLLGHSYQIQKDSCTGSLPLHPVAGAEQGTTFFVLLI